jgi:hypothetical protein
VAGIGVSDDALRVITQCELGVSEERVIGGSDEPTSHLQDGVRRSGLDSRGQLLSPGFLFSGRWLGHDDLLPE